MFKNKNFVFQTKLLPSPRREYQGEQRVRYAVADIKPMDYAAESRRLLGLIRG